MRGDDRDDDSFESTIGLVRGAQDGDRRALEDLFSRYLPRIRQIVALRTGRKLRQMLELDDIVQEVLLKLLRGLDRFDANSEGSFRHWLARCAECEIVDRARHLDRKKRGGGQIRRFADCDSRLLRSSIFHDDDAATPSELAQADELAERIEDELLAMSEHNREVIILRAVCGMSYSEVAQELGIEPVSARVAFSRAIDKLKAAVGI